MVGAAEEEQLTQIDDVWDDAGLANKYSKSQSAYYTTNGHHYGVLYEELLIDPDLLQQGGIQEGRDLRPGRSPSQLRL